MNQWADIYVVFLLNQALSLVNQVPHLRVDLEAENCLFSDCLFEDSNCSKHWGLWGWRTMCFQHIFSRANKLKSARITACVIDLSITIAG